MARVMAIPGRVVGRRCSFTANRSARSAVAFRRPRTIAWNSRPPSKRSRRCAVEFHTDSNYLRDGITKWLHGWKRNGWKTQAKQPVKNEDLWRELDAVVAKHEINWHWVKGHAGDAGNERCDTLATAAIAAVKQKFSREQLAASLREFNEGQKAAAAVGLLPLG
jgi:hypothetical protein